MSYRGVVFVLLVWMLPACVDGQASGLKAGISSQRDLIDVGKALFHVRPKPVTLGGRPFYFSILPSGSPAGNTNLFITSTTAAFYAGAREYTFLSTVTFARSEER